MLLASNGMTGKYLNAFCFLSRAIIFDLNFT